MKNVASVVQTPFSFFKLLITIGEILPTLTTER